MLLWNANAKYKKLCSHLKSKLAKEWASKPWSVLWKEYAWKLGPDSEALRRTNGPRTGRGWPLARSPRSHSSIFVFAKCGFRRRRKQLGTRRSNLPNYKVIRPYATMTASLFSRLIDIFHLKFIHYSVTRLITKMLLIFMIQCSSQKMEQGSRWGAGRDGGGDTRDLVEVGHGMLPKKTLKTLWNSTQSRGVWFINKFVALSTLIKFQVCLKTLTIKWTLSKIIL